MTGYTGRTAEDWDRFSRHAAPEAIAAVLCAERGRLARTADLVSKLEVLLARRNRQVADGEWPPREERAGTSGHGEQVQLGHVRPAGCICIMFRDVLPARVADLTCTVHGVGGTDPGDGEWQKAEVPS